MEDDLGKGNYSQGWEWVQARGFLACHSATGPWKGKVTWAAWLADANAPVWARENPMSLMGMKAQSFLSSWGPLGLEP